MHLQVILDKGGQVPEAFQRLELPDAMRYLWEWFVELSAARGSAGFGPAPITHLDLLAWSVLNELTLTWWEREAIRLLDNRFLVSMAQQGKGGNDG